MSSDDEIEMEMIGDSIDDVRKKLYKLYGKDAKIIDKRTEWKYYFFHLIKKPKCLVTYVLNHQQSYEHSSYSYKEEEAKRLEENQKKFIEQQSSFIAVSKISKELQDLKNDLALKIEQVNDKVSSGGTNKHPTVARIEELLQENEFSFSYISMIVEKINSTFPPNELSDFNLVQRKVIDWIGQSISIAKEKVFRPPHVFVLVGPTGVGKTTTLSKFMAQTILTAKMNQQRIPDGCFITIDNIRAGSYKQLKKLGDTVGYPVLKAIKSEDFMSIYQEYKEHVDNIFVDTAGCSPNDAEHLAVMQKILDVNINPDIYLTVTATTKVSDLSYIFRNYEPFNYDKVIVTKIDESRQIGNIISILWEKHKSIAYMTNGQHSKDIKEASVIEILKCLSGFEIDRVHVEQMFGPEQYAD